MANNWTEAQINEIVASVLNKSIDFYETVGIKEKCEAFARSKLASGVLSGNALFAAAKGNFFAQLLQLFIFVHVAILLN